MLTIMASKTVMAAMDSITTTARGTIMGSCLPLMATSISSPEVFTVCCFVKIEGVGFTWARSRMGKPSLMPPRMPPAWLVYLTI